MNQTQHQGWHESPLQHDCQIEIATQHPITPQSRPRHHSTPKSLSTQPLTKKINLAGDRTAAQLSQNSTSLPKPFAPLTPPGLAAGRHQLAFLLPAAARGREAITSVMVSPLVDRLDRSDNIAGSGGAVAAQVRGGFREWQGCQAQEVATPSQ